MKVLVFGGSGLVGKEVVRVLKSVGYEVSSPSHSEYDIGSTRTAGLIKDSAPSVIVNCTAYNQVDRAESREGFADAYNTNVRGVENLVLAATVRGCNFIHLSTDYVFDGRGGSNPYHEDVMPDPINRYGWTKLMGEQRIAEVNCQMPMGGYAIIRTSWVFGPGRKTFIDNILKKALADAEDVEAWEDQVGTITYAPHLAEGIRAMIQQWNPVKWGNRIFHFANGGAVNRVEWAQYAIKKADARLLMRKNLSAFVKPTKMPQPSGDGSGGAMRPTSTPLDSTKFMKTFGMKIPTWEEATVEYINNFAGQDLVWARKEKIDREKARYSPQL